MNTLIISTREVLKHIVQYFEKGKELAMSSFVQSIEKEVLRELVLSAVWIHRV